MCQPADSFLQAVQLYCRSLTRVLLLLLLKSAVRRMWQQALDHLYLHYVFKPLGKTAAVHHSVWHRSASSAYVCQPADSSLQGVQLYCRSLTRVLLLLLLLLKSAVNRMWQQALDRLYLHVFICKEKQQQYITQCGTDLQAVPMCASLLTHPSRQYSSRQYIWQKALDHLYLNT
jgi:protein tyrosine phosphatase (PTP) superfamily phosphohydrolase (DUF442 family)